MNILYIAPQKVVTGASLSLIGVVRNLSSHNKIYVIVEDLKTEYAKELIKAGAELIEYKHMPIWLKTKPKSKVKWFAMRIKRIVLNNTIFRFELYRIKNNLIDKKIDIVHSNLRITSIGGWIANKLDVPHVWHIREYGEEDFNLYSIYNTNYMYRVMKKNGEAMIAIADGIVDKFKPIFGEKVVKISNGINLERFINQKKEILNKDIITIGMTSIVSETKGQREFLYALSQIEKPIRDKLNIIIAGACYDEKYLDELNDIVVKGNMEKQVTMLGYVNNVETVLKQLDILVVASRAEAFGRVTVEGMAAGCLIIGANSGGTKEILENGKYGLLYDANNVLDLKEKILYAVNNNAEMRVVAKEAQKKSIEKYSEIRNAKEIEKLYKKLCGDKDD